MRQKIRKGIITFTLLLFPLLFLFMSPYIIVLAAAKGFINGSAVLFGCLFLFSIVGSRLFCGWVCPGGAIQDNVAQANSRPWNSKWKNASKYIIWVVWLSFIIWLWSTHTPLKINLFYHTGVNKTQVELLVVIIYFIVVTLIYVFTILTGKRGMCHSLCWMAPFMVLGEKVADFLHIPRFRLKATSEDCIFCGQCDKQCPMSLKVSDMVKKNRMDSTECVSCLKCVDACPKKVLQCGIFQKTNNGSGRFAVNPK